MPLPFLFIQKDGLVIVHSFASLMGWFTLNGTYPISAHFPVILQMRMKQGFEGWSRAQRQDNFTDIFIVLEIFLGWCFRVATSWMAGNAGHASIIRIWFILLWWQLFVFSDPHIALTLSAKILAPFVEQSPSLDMYKSAVLPNWIEPLLWVPYLAPPCYLSFSCRWEGS
jgi:hypothetical protein